MPTIPIKSIPPKKILDTFHPILPSSPQKEGADNTTNQPVSSPLRFNRFDEGDLDANWIESMNSVMDDNRLLTLPSNERIPLKAISGKERTTRYKDLYVFF